MESSQYDVRKFTQKFHYGMLDNSISRVILNMSYNKIRGPIFEQIFTQMNEQFIFNFYDKLKRKNNG